MTLMTATLDQPITADDLDDFPTDGTRREVMGGTLYVAAAPIRRHQKVLGRYYSRFQAVVERRGWGEVYFSPVDVRFSPVDQVQPDLIVLRRERLGIYQGSTVLGPPDVVVEVLSPSTRLYDQTQKRLLYMKGRVPEYWMLDPDTKTIEVLALRGDLFLPVPPEADGRYRSTVVPGLLLDPAVVFAGLDD